MKIVNLKMIALKISNKIWKDQIYQKRKIYFGKKSMKNK